MPHTFTPEKMRGAWIKFAVVDDSFESFDVRYYEKDIADYWIAKFEAYKAELRKEIEGKKVRIGSDTPEGYYHNLALDDILSSPLLTSNTKEV